MGAIPEFPASSYPCQYGLGISHADPKRTDSISVRIAREDLLSAVEIRLALGKAPADQRQCVELEIKEAGNAPADPAVLAARHLLIKYLEECPALTDAIESRFKQMRNAGFRRTD